MIRRDTLLNSLREERWNVLPVDVGNQVRRAVNNRDQVDTTAQALQQMDYKAVALGVHDLRLSKVDLIQIAGSEESSQRPFLAPMLSYCCQIFLPTESSKQVLVKWESRLFWAASTRRRSPATK